MDTPATGTITCSAAAAPADQHRTGRPLPYETPNNNGRLQDIDFDSNESDDHGNHMLSAVRNGPAAGQSEMGPRETTFTDVDPAAIGDMGPRGISTTLAAPNPFATTDGDGVPPLSQVQDLAPRGQYSPDNTPQQPEHFTIHDSMSDCHSVNDDASKCLSIHESVLDGCYSVHDSASEDELDHTGTNVNIADACGGEDETVPRVAESHDQDQVPCIAERFHIGGVQKRTPAPQQSARLDTHSASFTQPQLQPQRHNIICRWLILLRSPVNSRHLINDLPQFLKHDHWMIHVPLHLRHRPIGSSRRGQAGNEMRIVPPLIPNQPRGESMFLHLQGNARGRCRTVQRYTATTTPLYDAHHRIKGTPLTATQRHRYSNPHLPMVWLMGSRLDAHHHRKMAIHHQHHHINERGIVPIYPLLGMRLLISVFDVCRQNFNMLHHNLVMIVQALEARYIGILHFRNIYDIGVDPS
jgi:hypothetical protein